MHLNTLRTAIGFCRSFIERRIPFLRRSGSVEDIYNYLRIDHLFATSGQPSEAQFALISDAGYDTVINLAPASVFENAVIDEREILTGLGMSYVHLPVDFKAPTDADFERFVGSLREHAGSKIWVHCAANMRVSAFTYRYRRTVLDENPQTAEADLRRIWDPVGVWKSFIAAPRATAQAGDAGLPNDGT